MEKTNIEIPTQIDIEEKVSEWAHDLRSPFNLILGFTKIMMNEQSGPLTEVQKEDLTTVFNSSMRALTLINNVIEIARLNRGEQDIEKKYLELEPFLEKSIAKWIKNNPAGKIPITYLISSPALSAKLDKRFLEWVLHGLFSYLAAYSDGSGNIALEVGQIKDSLLFTIDLTGKTKESFDKISLEMFGYICKEYISLQSGELRQFELNPEGAKIQFTIAIESNQ
ncbi:MAG: histidine kinase dimerization/phospho-acceptor domain-containing protein [Anaerolineae bacterium]|nr:histidine kinase dimerization/phospho-acceptor domain-containing protein [Anaerolineae bacterium]MDK1080562.1 histidine kinase dimerization/phospho-acceptor domain-containing protein [Anaerolineae bacterium]MDK1117437.1 histidine kinase dimerization/phospho-acceptor domain-containing protein [Anaerolineae bacterium]